MTTTPTNSQSRFTFAVLLWLLTLGCTNSSVPPKGTNVTGASGGCGHFTAYRFNQARTLAVVVRVDEDQIELSDEPTEIVLGPNATGVEVEVYQFGQPAGEYFCDDVGGDPEPIAKWTVTGGNVSISRTAGKPPANLSNATHKISAVLENMTITHTTTGATAHFGDVNIESVWVGWIPG